MRRPVPVFHGSTREGQVAVGEGVLSRCTLSQKPLVWAEREISCRACPSESPFCHHPTDGYSTVDRREKRARGSASAGETSEKEPLKVSSCGQVSREAACLGVSCRGAQARC